jgi:putative MATE family efflux protein
LRKKQLEINMTEGPFLKKIIKYAIPIIFTGILQSLYSAADLIVVGQFEGDIALAAVGSTGSLTNLVVGLFMGLSAGAGVSVAHYLGAKREKEVSGVLHTSILLSLILGVVVSVIGYVFAPQMLKLMGNPNDVIEYSTLYIRIIFLGMPASLVYNYAAAMLRSSGDTKHPLIFLSVSGIANVFLNLVLIIFFHMGVAGVAIGTIASQYLAAVMIMVHLSKLEGCLHFSVNKLKITPRKLKKILYIGLPSGLQGSLFSLSNVLIQSSINSFGSDTMSGAAAAGNIEGFLYIALNAFYHASLTFVGQNVGAKKFENIKKIIGCSVASVVVIGVVLQAFALIFARQLIGLYAEGEEAIHQGVVKMFVMMSTYFLCGIMEVFSGGLRGMGRSFTSMLISLSGACLFRIIWLETIFKWVNTPTSIYLSYPISWTLTSLCSMIFLILAVKKESKKLEKL